MLSKKLAWCLIVDCYLTLLYFSLFVRFVARKVKAFGISIVVAILCDSSVRVGVSID